MDRARIMIASRPVCGWHRTFIDAASDARNSHLECGAMPISRSFRYHCDGEVFCCLCRFIAAAPL
jgi:hypothetical protein